MHEERAENRRAHKTGNQNLVGHEKTLLAETLDFQIQVNRFHGSEIH